MMMAAVPPVAADMIMLIAMMDGTAWYGMVMGPPMLDLNMLCVAPGEGGRGGGGEG